MGTLLAVLLLILSGPKAGRDAEPLDGLIAFSDPAFCRPAENFQILLDSLLRFEEAGESYRPVLTRPVVPSSWQPLIGEPTLTIEGSEYVATLPVRGEWRGLPLRAVRITGWIESEQGFTLVFESPPEQVLRAANAAGFGLPDSGARYVDGEVMGVSIGVEREAGGAALYCVPG
jgi:hypothetical protein